MQYPYLKLDLSFLLLAVLLCVILIGPMLYYEIPFPFITEHIIFIVVFAFMVRHIFLLKHSFLGKSNRLRLFFILASIFVFLYLLKFLNAFLVYADENTLSDLMMHLSYTVQQQLANYLRWAYVISAVGALVGTAIFPFVLFRAVWKSVNRK